MQLKRAKKGMIRSKFGQFSRSRVKNADTRDLQIQPLIETINRKSPKSSRIAYPLLHAAPMQLGSRVLNA